MPANAFLTTTLIGGREDLTDVIYNVSPSDTPLISSIEKVGASAITHEWQRDTLATPANNRVNEGEDASYTAVVPTERLANTLQISRKTFSISHTAEKINKAGRKSEIRYQTVKQGKELRRDMELALIENPTRVLTGQRQSRGLRGWLQTNNSLGVGGAAPVISTNTAPTDGTLRTFTEPLLRAGVLAAYAGGGDIDMLMVAPALKQTISTTFNGGGTKFVTSDDKKLQATYDVYASDFGQFRIVPNRQMARTREAYLIDDSMVALAVLRDMQTEELAKIGSATNFMIEGEYCLEVREERAMACIRDLQP